MKENEWFKHLETLLIRQKKISQVLKDKELEKMNKNWNIADLISETDFCVFVVGIFVRLQNQF